ncbi:flavodoxin domain-containing protein [Stackebrandtia nassauensis]|uniref:Flavodoxin domain-containing protein n=1 Tax=Stackebrandtia nassauensis (strain DSM 44728 / CIP 108903 / NRRL B-16338 / NBRC 102104 / LLR-40K-21) TaxID=446470 RepID=D3PXJ0_STANL|nr:flavodoxin domain-containing protein [Stackebrandtia nassauensis]ADD43320.1 hypothetical protein Snas_3662 [Stackebrandtia nassauensis DSM 44728]
MARGFTVETKDVEAVTSLTGFDVVVVGSAVYYGRWRRQANRFVKRFSSDLKQRRVRIFESGWVGQRPARVEPTRTAKKWAERFGAGPVAVFGGRLDPELAKTYLDRALTRRMASDSRDWPRVRDWAGKIADEVKTAADGE